MKGKISYSLSQLLIFCCMCSSACGPDPNATYQRELKARALALLVQDHASKKMIAIGQIFPRLGDGICVSRIFPGMRQLEKSSSKEFFDVIPLLDDYDRNNPATNPSGDYDRIYFVTGHQILKTFEIDDNSSLIAIAGQGCYRFENTVLIENSDQNFRVGITFGLQSTAQKEVMGGALSAASAGQD